MRKTLLTLFLLLGTLFSYAQSDVVVFSTNDGSYEQGQVISFTITVTNNGPDPAANVHVYYPIPSGITIPPGINRFWWSGTNSSQGTNVALNNTIASLGVNQTVVYTIHIKIPSDYDGELPEVSVTYNTQSAITVVNTDNQEQYTPGSPSVYTLTVSNAGPEAAYNVHVNYPMPAGITQMSWTGNGTSGTDAAIDDYIAQINPGQTVTYTITVQVPSSYTGNLTTQAAVTASVVGGTPDCTQCTDTDTNSVGADIVVNNSDGQTIYTPGAPNVYTITVTNNGTLTAQNVSVEFVLSSGITTVTWVGDNGSSGDINNLTDAIGDLADGETVTYTFTLDVPLTYTGSLVVSTVVDSDTNDPDPSCDNCVDIDSDVPSADIVVVNTDNQDIYTPGTTSVYTVTVTNNGPTDALNVQVSNPIPAGITGFSWTGDDGSSGTNTDLFDIIPVLALHQTVTYTINLDVPAGYTGDLTSQTTVTSDTPDPDPTCDACSDTDQGATSADIVVTNTLNSGTQYTAGMNLVYTITVENQGPTAAVNVNVEDLVPAGLDPANAYWVGDNGTSGTGNLNDIIPVLMNGETVTYQFTIPVPSGYDQTANITNTVTQTSDTPDPNPGCTACIVTATPNPQANLVTVKTDGITEYLVDEDNTYTITVTNPGPSDAYNVHVTDPVPINIVQFTWSGNGNGGSGSVDDTIDVLPAGESMTYTINLHVPANYADFIGNLQNVATVTSDTPDPVPACPTCTDTDTPRGDFVTVTQNQYTVPELVKDVLIGTKCVGIENITWKSNGQGNSTGIGYFHRNNSDFPIKDGLALVTGNAVDAGGGNTYTMSSGGWPGDTDLFNYIQGLGIDPWLSSYNDATIVEFDFTPLSNHMSFDFLFASEEYGTYQCDFSDAFAFFLTDSSTGTTTNLALIPGTTTPVSVITIRDSANNPGCASQNIDYFGQYNNESPTSTAPINFNGQTVVMTAESDVTPFTQYHIKLVIADRNDTALNSGVFIAGGSFDIGQPTLPDDLTILNDQALCPGGSTVLTPSSTADFNYKWEKDGVPILDDNGDELVSDSLTVTEPGVYTVKADIDFLDCELSDDILIEYQPEVPAADPSDLTVCGDPTGTAIFDLTQTKDEMLAPLDNPLFYVVDYYTSLDDIQNEEPGIYPPDAFEGHDGQTIYVGITGFSNFCTTIRSFTLHIVDCNIPLNDPEPMYACDPQPYDGVEVFDLTSQNDQIMSGIDQSQYTISYHNTQEDADNDGANPIADPANYTGGNETVYIRVQSNTDPTIYNTTSMQLVVTPQPVVEEVEDVEACDSYILPALSEGNYYTGAGGTGTMIPAGTAITTSQTIYVYASNGTAPNNCTDEKSFDVTINQTPVVDEPADVAVCDSYTLPALSVGDYYTGPDGTGTMLAAGDAITTTQLLYVYAQTGTDVVCSDEWSFTVTVNYAPTTVSATDLEVCDDNFDGIAFFDLTPAGNEVMNGQSGLTASYYETMADAQNPNSNNAIPNPSAYSNINPESQIIYIRVVQTGTTTNCYSIEPVNLIVHPRPSVETVTDYVQCDDNNPGDGMEVFDLTGKDAEVTGGASNVTVTYYASQSDLDNDQPIASPSSYTNTTAWEQEIFAKATSDFGCETVMHFNLVVNPLPVVNPDLGTFYACEEIPGQGEFNLTEMIPDITGGASGYNVAFYDNQASAQNGGSDYLASPYTSPTATIYATLTDAVTGCMTVTPVALEVIPAPIAPDPAPLEECDFNNDGFAQFNLDPVIQQISDAIGGNVNITIHETADDAQFGTNAIPNTGSYTNIHQDTQTLWIRVKSSQTECFDVVTLQLIVNPVPEATTPSDYELCDDGNNDTDGISTFDLTTRDAEVLGTMSPADFTVTYYQSQSAAELGQGPISTPSSYASPSAIVWVRVTNNATGCYDVVPLQLIVNPLPVANQPTPYTLCDNDNPGDETEVFDLTTKIPEIINVNGVPQEGLNVDFYTTYAAAQVGDTTSSNYIPNPDTYQNDPTVQTLFVRVTNEATGCYRIVLLDVRVEPLPVLYPEFLDADATTACDPDGDGIATFDLQALVEQMVSNGQNLEVTFHETAEDAMSGLNPIPNPQSYQNDIPYTDQVYVRVVNTVTGCSNSTPYILTLTVIASPQIPDHTLEDITQCDDQDNNGQDGQAYFDLTQQDAVLYALEGIGPDYVIHYFISQDYAQAGAPRITTPSHYHGTDGQTIWVRVEDPESGCFGIDSFQLHLNQPLALTTPTMLTMCETELPNDGIATFDLTVKDNEILGPFGVGMGNTVTYYASQADYDAGTPIAEPAQYTNIQNAQTLVVEVTTPEGCTSRTTLTIKVLPLPLPDTTPDALELCDDNNSPDGVEVFDLTQAEQDIRNNDNSMVLTYFTTQDDAENDVNPIADPTAYSSATGSVWVRAEANTGNPNDEVCYQVVELQLIVNPLPELGDGGTIEPFAHCEQNTDGYSEFLLTEHIPAILGDQNPDDYTVRFYLTQANAEAGGPALPNLYTNTTQGQQTIWVKVTNTNTGCVNIGSFDLLVEEQAIANPVTTVFEECDYDGDNDGVYTFDLTQADSEVLGTQSPASDFQITYYESQADAQAGTNAIADPAAYQNSTPDQMTIWVRIVNTATISGCPDFTSFTLTVHRLPVPVLQGGTICVDYNTGEALRTLTLDTGLSDADNTFVWYLDGVVIPGATGATYEAGQAGSYTVEATSIAGGCVSDPVTPAVVQMSGPAAPVDQGYEVTNAFSDNQEITINVEGYGQYQYSLDYGPYQDSNVFTNVTPGPHTVHVLDVSTDDPCGEFVLDIDEVSVIDYPNFFTPNGDGRHDTWNIIGMESQPEAKVYIYDRYGKLLKQISTAGEGWDGTYNGVPLPADDYWFTVTYRENGVIKEFKAHFALKR